MIETSDLKRSVDLLVLASRDTHLKKVSGTRGGEFAGPCRKCGGRDRFRIQPEQGLWFCRNCTGRWQDAIAYVQWRDGVTFAEACRILGAPEAGPTPTAPPKKPKPTIPTVPTPASDPEPTSAWRTAAAEEVE